MELLKADATNQYHLLRHYVSCSKEYLQTLIGKKYQYYDYQSGQFVASIITQKDLEVAFRTRGSKFFTDVPGIENPKALIEVIKVQIKKLKLSKPGAFIFEYPVAVGEANLVTIETLGEKQKQQIVKVPRSNQGGDSQVIIQTISGIVKKPTKKIVVELTIVDKHLNVTAYPGEELSPDFSDQKFWDSHVFVE